MLFGKRNQCLAVRFILTLAITFAPVLVLAQTGPTSLSISGVMLKSDGTPVLNSSVSFRFELYDKNATCVLYSEEHLGVDLSASKGRFSLTFGKGTNPQNFLENSAAFSARLFQNDGSPQVFTGCAGVTLNSGDERVIRVHYNLGSGYLTMTPDVGVESSGFALVADTLRGKTPSDFVQLRDDATYDLTQANVQNVFSATNYARLNTLLSSSGSFSFGSQRITSVADPTSAQDAATKNYTDTYVAGKQIDLQDVGAGTGDGKVLTWDAAQGKWVAEVASATDSSKLPLAGGTMSGAINMGSHNLLATGHITMSAQTTLNLGTYTDAQETTLVGTLAAVDKGKSWYNSDDNVLKVWDGSRAVTQAYLSNTDKIQASWLPDTAVTGGSYGSATQVATFTVGADGRLTAAGNTTISGVSPGGSAGGDLTGSYPSPTIASDVITSAKVNSTGVAVNRLLITNASDGSTIGYATCSVGEVMKWTASGWACAADDGSGGSGDITEVTAGTGLTGGSITGAVTLGVDVGTTAGQIVQMAAGDKLPAVDGSDLTNLNAVKLQTRSVASTAPNNSEVLKWNSTTSVWEPSAVGSLISGSYFAQNGNSFGAESILGTNDAFPLHLETSGSTRITVTASGNVGVGTTDPSRPLQINGVSDGTALFRLQTNSTGIGVYRGIDFANNNGTQYAIIEPSVTSGGPAKFDFKVKDATAVTSYLQIDGSNKTVNVLNSGTLTVSGSVGIGTTSLSARLSVVGSNPGTSTSSNLSVYDSGNTLRTTIRGTGAQVWYLNDGTAEAGNITYATPGNLPGLAFFNTSGTGRSQIRQLGTSGGLGFGATTGSSNPGDQFVLTTTGNVGIGTSAPNDKLDVAGKIRATHVCASDGSNCKDLTTSWGSGGAVTAVTAGSGLSGGTITTSGTLSVDVGTTAGQIVQMAAGDKLPAVDGSDLTNVNAVKLQTRSVASTAPSNGQVLKWNNTTSLWEPSADADTDTGITALTGDVSASGAGSVTATLANSVVTSAKIVDGTIATADIANNAVTSAKLNTLGVAVNRLLITDSSTGANVRYATCSTDEVLKWTASGWACSAAGSLISGSYFAQGGNSFGAAAVLGTDDSYALHLESGGTTRMTVATDGNVGIGQSAPQALLHLQDTALGEADLQFSLGATSTTATSYALPTTAASSGTGTGWSGINNIKLRDGTVTVVTGQIPDNGDSAEITVTGFGIAIPASAEIRGVEVRIRAQNSGLDDSALKFRNIRLVNAGTPVGTAKADSAYWDHSSLQDRTYGSSTDVWGTTLTGADVNAANFGVVFEAWDANTSSGEDAEPEIDSVELRVYYVEDQVHWKIGSDGADSSKFKIVSGSSFASHNRLVIDTSGNIGIGTTAPGDLLDVAGKIRATHICATDGSNCKDLTTSWGSSGSVTEVTAGSGLSGGTITTSGTLSVDVGTTAGQIVQMAAGDKLPAVDGSDLTNVNAVKLQTRSVASTAPNNGEVLKWNSTTSVWEPSADTDTDTGITALTGDVSASGTGSVAATLADSVVTSAKIVDGTVATADIADNAVTSAKLNSAGVAVNRLLITDASSGTQVRYATCSTDEVLKWTASGWACSTVSSLISGSYFVQNGSSFGAEAVLGTNDAYPLHFEAGGATRMTVAVGGNVGIGTTAPSEKLSVAGVVESTSGGFKFPDGTTQVSANAAVATSMITSWPDAIRCNYSATEWIILYFNGTSGALTAYNGVGNTGAQLAFTTSTGAYSSSTGLYAGGTYNCVNSSISADVTAGRTFMLAGGGAGIWTKSGVDGYFTGGNVGIGTSLPRGGLDVSNGSLVLKAAVSNTAGPIDFGTGNLQYTTNACGSFSLYNMKDGGTYTLAVQGAAGGTCAFTAYSDNGSEALTVKNEPINLIQTANKHALFTFVVLGSYVYVASVDGY